MIVIPYENNANLITMAKRPAIVYFSLRNQFNTYIYDLLKRSSFIKENVGKTIIILHQFRQVHIINDNNDNKQNTNNMNTHLSFILLT